MTERTFSYLLAFFKVFMVNHLKVISIPLCFLNPLCRQIDILFLDAEDEVAFFSDISTSK